MWFTALLMGFAGSLHCVGMCSPLAMAVSNLNPAAIFNRFIYNLGRILTYGILGSVVGTAGWALPYSSFQNLLSVVLGVTLLFFGMLSVGGIRIPGVTSLFQKIVAHLKKLFGKFLQRKNLTSVFILGSLNGMLPCGLTFIALAYCLTLNSPVTSFYFMLLFGLGTLPAMLGLTSGLQYLIRRFNISFKKVTTIMLFISGCLLIARVFFFHQAHFSSEAHEAAEIILCR